MGIRFASLLQLLALAVVLGAVEPALAVDDSEQKPAASKLDGLLGLIGAVNGLQIPDLSGLIQPEKMGMLTDNTAIARDNQAHVLSDNQTETSLLSGNRPKLLSGIRLFSGITINVHISIHEDASPPKAKKTDSRRNGKKAKSRKTGRKTNKVSVDAE